MRNDRASCIHLTCSSCLIKVPPLNTPPHLPLEHPNSLSRRTVTKIRTDGYTSPLQTIMHLLIRLKQFEVFFCRRMMSFLLASLVIKFLGVLLTFSVSKLSVTSHTSQLILQPFRRFTYVTVHSPTFPLLHLLHSSFSNPSFASRTSQALHLRHLASRPCL